ncbi:TonB-dependent receptor plug domain-containing protein [Spirosoma oryzicola]|uniref:TonB-dependent receptor plug domain-containing protein n=1 Tax=Spirosoma oryzicola TaxID=2898794 RepID=UPI001E36AB45|nr:TonB-dependent receptor [Spirosoma oryzicola]UHG90778.1 TonB-dependent receptor [Spirosoma oryzicola]
MKHIFLFLFFTSQAVASTMLPDSTINPKDSLRKIELNEIVVTASRISESVLKSPVSIEVLDARQIRMSAQPSYFDAIENLKGVQLMTASLGFKVYNTRGFANPTNVRFVQLVDGMDNQAPHIGAPIANALAPSDLDIQRVEIVPGAASALYGMNALNGLAQLITKDPFTSRGLSISQKTGVNHINDPLSSAKVFSETSLRYANTIGSRLAFKVNLTYQRGYDWIARDLTDLNPNANTTLGLTGPENPGRDLVNNYGDESANRRTLTIGGKRYVVSRTGYFENETTDLSLNNLRGDAAIFWRILPKLTISYRYKAATLDNVYQRTNRFRLDNYVLDQHGLTLESPSVQIRAYRTRENTGDSYNIRSMAENIDKSFKSDNQWFTDFTNQFTASTAAGQPITNALATARTFADAGRPQPGSETFDSQIARLRDINNWDIGAALRVKSWMYHVEGQVEPTRVLWAGFRQKTGIDLLAGFDYRRYVVFPDGNYFINPDRTDHNLIYGKTGGFVQASRSFFGDRLSLRGSVRVDKNRYFDPKVNPRISLVFSPTENHNFRASYQTGYRFPSLFEAFSNVNSGGVKRVGGLKIMSQGIFENSYFRTSIDAFQNAITTDVNTNKLTTEQAIQKNKGLLRPNTYTYLKPEQVNSIEVGYKGLFFTKKLYVDVDFYYNVYRNFIAQVEANIPKRSNPDSIPYYLADRNQQDRYRLWTNSKTTVYNYGSSLGLRYSAGHNWVFSGNASLARLDRTDQGDGLEEAFNTPQWITNLSVSNPDLGNGFGFSINYKYQSSFLWQSSLATGMVPAINTFDVQISYALPARTLGPLFFKLGATNLLNRSYTTFTAGPSVGGFYYATVTLNIPQ